MSSPATMPDVTVAVSGVLLRVLSLAKHLKSRPSSAMAQITLGIGNMEPSKLLRRKKNQHAMSIKTHKAQISVVK